MGASKEEEEKWTKEYDEWYKKNDRGLYDGPNQKYVQKMIRKVACPLN